VSQISAIDVKVAQISVIHLLAEYIVHTNLNIVEFGPIMFKLISLD
jgi:hypothetical protein